jgi:acetyl esterase/lipase
MRISRVIRFMYWLLLIFSAALLFVTAWILLPAPNAVLLPLGVGAPELSPLLFGVAIVLCIVSAVYARPLHVARLALVLSLVAACLSALPLIQLPGTLKRFQKTMGDALGSRTVTPISVVNLFRPPRMANARVVRGVQFAAPGGAPLSLDIYKPPASGRYPILVQVYGGAWQRGAPGDNEWFARYFASRGFVVIAVDYRHAPAWKWPAQLEDMHTALKWIAGNGREFDGDPSRIIMLGRSSGAQLAMTAAYTEPSPSILAVVSYYGPVDLEEGWRHPPQPDPLNVRAILETFLGGTPEQVPNRYRAASPATYASNRLPPTLLIYGARDHIVEGRFGDEMDRALRKAGAMSVLLKIPWSEHAFDLIPNGLGGQIALSYTETFMTWALEREVSRGQPRGH